MIPSEVMSDGCRLISGVEEITPLTCMDIYDAYCTKNCGLVKRKSFQHMAHLDIIVEFLGVWTLGGKPFGRNTCLTLFRHKSTHI